MKIDPHSLREWAVSANDGVIATAGMLEGFAAAGATDSMLVMAASAATVAGALGVGGAKWAEDAAERESQLQIVAAETAQLNDHPDDEIAELTGYWEGKGLTPDLARSVAEQLSSRDALAAQLESEYGITAVMTRSAPVWSGLSAAIAFALGAAVPLLITIFVPVALEVWVIVAAVVVALVLTSLVIARASRVSPWRTMTRALVVGLGTMAISYLAGLVLF